MYLLFPGRHQLLTNFQFNYLYRIIQAGLSQETDANGQLLGNDFGPIDAIIFAVTSANHSHTRRNPLPFHLRVLQLEDFSDDLPVPAYMYGIDEVGVLENFADYTIKRIRHESDGMFDLTPQNTVVVCSTPVMNMYEKLDFRVLPAELLDRQTQQFVTGLPWDLVEYIAKAGDAWLTDRYVLEHMHPASYSLWKKYKLGEKVQMLFRDRIISDDGDITTTRDYNSYVRQMDDIAELKFKETAPYIRPGRIGDIGCAVGSWIRLACQQDLLHESDFYGIEVARHLFDICQQRKHNGEFGNPFVFFAQKNAVTGLVYEKNSMHTINTSSLTHEIESYGSREDLLTFIRNRYEELATGGIWINRDVVGPDNPDEEVVLVLTKEDGRNDDWEREITNRDELSAYLQGLSTYARFLRFARDFRHKENEALHYELLSTEEHKSNLQLSLRNAMEFLLKKDYTDNWQSEMHEKFCFWTYADWEKEMSKAGFSILPQSHAYQNDWIVKNRFTGKAELFSKTTDGLKPLDFPVTHMLFLAEKRIL
ncbi:transferase [Xanthocytophaga agilis]|uniref:Transferase n=1 Tax=Xanthocytophaga agilis TaxID=3048010 RepID=A0AAE3R4E4_9BACT|nr:transferase [Xanthocytophaga agilis]MDJ1502970.1 transferase [Xanthocytophaga agilis]